jgi:pilus assembly protein TadC
MKRIKETIRKMEVKALCAMKNFKDSERGDTNFVSMLLIISIVVILAGIFLTLGQDTMQAVTDKVTEFINKM